MSSRSPHRQCYLVEWYQPEVTIGQLDHTVASLANCTAAMRGEGSLVQLLMTLGVPTDEVIFGVFAAGSADAVAEACRRAGLPAERLSTAVDARLAGTQ